MAIWDSLRFRLYSNIDSSITRYRRQRDSHGLEHEALGDQAIADLKASTYLVVLTEFSIVCDLLWKNWPLALKYKYDRIWETLCMEFFFFPENSVWCMVDNHRANSGSSPRPITHWGATALCLRSYHTPNKYKSNFALDIENRRFFDAWEA